jgi:hypothetical protein
VEQDEFVREGFLLAQEYNMIVQAAHRSKLDTFPDGPYIDIDMSLGDLHYANLCLEKLPLNPIKAPKNKALKPGAVAITCNGGGMILVDSKFTDIHGLDINGRGPFPTLRATKDLQERYPRHKISDQDVLRNIDIYLKDLIWTSFMMRSLNMNNKTLGLRGTVASLNYQAYDLRESNLILLPPNVEVVPMPYIPRVPPFIDIGMMFMPKGTYLSQMDEKTWNIHVSISKCSFPCTQYTFEDTFFSSVLPIINVPGWEEKNAIFQKSLFEFSTMICH